MNLTAGRKEIADWLRSAIDGLNTFASPPGRITPPSAIVQPTEIEYHGTFRRRMVKLPQLGLLIVTGKPNDESSHIRLDEYLSDSGERSIPYALESHQWTNFDDVTAIGAAWNVVTFNEIDYLAALLALDITGQGGN